MSYDPPSSPVDYRGPKKFHREYIAPLGRGRKNVKMFTNEVIIESNRPGMLNLATNLIDLSLAGFIDEFRLEPVEELDPPGGWFGDLEPNSPTILVERIGPPSHSPNGFRYEVPPFRIEFRPAMENGSTIELTRDRYKGNLEAVIRGTTSALLSMAKHAAYLSQAPDGAKIVYGRSEGVNDARNRLVFQRTRFAEGVPWAKSPTGGQDMVASSENLLKREKGTPPSGHQGIQKQ